MIFNKGYTLQAAQERCLNRCHNRVACDHCVSHCPAGAILIHHQQVWIDKEKCLGCGLCLSDCPTGVFSSSQWDETTIAREIDLHGWKTTEFFCADHAAVSRDRRDPTTGAVRLSACLSSISRGAWFELGLKTEIDLNIDPCDGCPMGKTFPRLATNVGTAMEWLEAAGRPARIHFVNRCEQDPSAKRREMIDAGLKVTSRRDLFLSLIQRARQATRAVEVDLSCKPEDDYLPGWRKRFARVYQENALPSSAAVYWPTIKIDDRCVNCGMCSMFCPSGALQIREEDGTAQHSFTSGYCLDCRICEMICSVGAIRRDRELVANPFEQITISSAAIMACKRCGDTTTTNPEGLCYWCQQENAIETGLMETYKSIFLSPGS